MSYNCAEREQMYLKNPKCHWCGRIMRLYKDGEVPRFCSLPDDAATIDHIYPLHTPQRNWYKRMGRKSPVVLACNGCNNRRNNLPYGEFEKLIKSGNKQKYFPQIG